LLVFDIELAFKSSNLFSILADLTLVLSLDSLQLSNLLVSVRQFSQINFLLFLCDSQIIKNSPVPAVKVTVLSMHLIKLRLEFQSQRNFFLVIFMVLVEIGLELGPHCFLL
jgi:hypothetical protein